MLLLSSNYAPELTGIGKYNGEFVAALAKRQIKSLVVTAPPYYPEWKRHQGFTNWWSTAKGCEYATIYRCPIYVPNKLSTIKRLIHLASFSVSSSLRLLTLLRKRPDVVFVVQPTLFCAPVALLFSKLTGAKSVMHIQDFEVDAMFGLGMSQSSLLKRIAVYIESFLLKRFDVVSSISYSMLERAKSKGASDNQLHLFPNWADLNFVTPEVSGDKLRAQWGYSPDDYIVLYSGNVGEKQGLEIILEAASALTADKQLKFIIIGNGANRALLEQKAKSQGLVNIEFKPLQAWELMPEILAMADLHLVVQRCGAADAVLPSKLTNILAAGGHALVTAEPTTELGKIAARHPGIYHCIEPENSKLFIKTITDLVSEGKKTNNSIAREYAINHMDLEHILEAFLQKVSSIK
ncbi:WcaI family glycosyltransferase [Colwellia sp. MEBiC06753]